MFQILQNITRVFVPQMRSSWNSEMKSKLLQKSFHTLRPLTGYSENLKHSQRSSLLMPDKSIEYIQVCGLKYVGKVHRRCKDCNLMLIAGVMHNHCKTHPRHNQKAKTKRPKSTWIVTAAIQTKVRSW